MAKQTDPDHIELDRPIVILGAPRSGTSFIGALLGQHDEVHYVIEPRFTWRYGNDSKSDALRDTDAKPEVIQFINGKLAGWVANADRKRLVEKTPSNSLRPEFVHAVLPEARFIHVQRDGVASILSIAEKWKRDAIGLRKGGPDSPRGSRIKERRGELSWRRQLRYSSEFFRRALPGASSKLLGPPLWGPRLPGLADMARELTVVELAVAQWRACVETVELFRRGLPPGKFHEVQLETLSPDVVERLLLFCELPVDSGVEEYFGRRFDRQRPRARDFDETEEANVVRRLIEPTVSWLMQ